MFHKPLRRSHAVRLFVLCSCCRRFIDWRAAKFVGYMQDDIERLELRNCACGTTMAIVVAEDELLRHLEASHAA